jgi:hypothetical protein
MGGAVPPLPNTPSWRGAQLGGSTQARLVHTIIFQTLIGICPNLVHTPATFTTMLIRQPFQSHKLRPLTIDFWFRNYLSWEIRDFDELQPPKTHGIKRLNGMEFANFLNILFKMYFLTYYGLKPGTNSFP